MIEVIPVQTKVSVITPGNEASKDIEKDEFLENEHRSAVDSAKFDGLRILISETFMERSESPLTITTLAERYGILCIDTLLEDPITFILDSATAVCIVEEYLIGQRHLLKEFVKQLTLLVYKFTCIWIIVTSHYHDSMEDKGKRSYADEGVAMMQLFAAISRFPIDIIVRSIASAGTPDSQSNRDTMMGKCLAKLVYHICNDTANAVCAYENILRESYLSRNFLNSLLCMDSFAFTEHCDFLQQFPSLNFYSAAQILNATTLQDIAYHLPEKINALKEILRFVPSISDFCLDSFLALYTLHCGLEKSLNTTAIVLLDNKKDVLAFDATHGRSTNSFENRAAPVSYTTSIGDDVGQYYALHDVPQDTPLIEDDDYQYYAENDVPQYDYITRGVEREDDFMRYDGPAVYSDPSIMDTRSACVSDRNYNSRGRPADFDRYGDDYDTQERGGKDRGNYRRRMKDFSADYS